MRADFKVVFKRIKGVPIDENISKNKSLLEATKKTSQILAKQIEKYFKKYKIDTEVKFEVCDGLGA